MLDQNPSVARKQAIFNAGSESWGHKSGDIYYAAVNLVVFMFYAVSKSSNTLSSSVISVLDQNLGNTETNPAVSFLMLEQNLEISEIRQFLFMSVRNGETFLPELLSGFLYLS